MKPFKSHVVLKALRTDPPLLGRPDQGIRYGTLKSDSHRGSQYGPHIPLKSGYSSLCPIKRPRVQLQGPTQDILTKACMPGQCRPQLQHGRAPRTWQRPCRPKSRPPAVDMGVSKNKRPSSSIVYTWVVKGLQHHDFGIYIRTILVLGGFGCRMRELANIRALI